jgi:ABC-type multidrug transport system ATPase subunit
VTSAGTSPPTATSSDPAPAVAARGLTKRYGKHRGVQDVTFVVAPGEICALLGPNGAGKTTAIRMLVGLSRPDHGAAELLGKPASLGADVLKRVGVVIDGPGLVPHLSGQRNLELLWKAGGRSWPPPALDTALQLAGLGAALDRKVKSYSAGMRQRLMLAQALMSDPRVLILDEPANGLDPGEVRALRDLLAELARDGAAVLISSHLLAEVEQLASHVVVLHNGAVITTGRLDEMLAGGAYEFDVDDLPSAQRALRTLDGLESVSVRNDRLLVTAPAHSAEQITHALVIAGVGVRGVRPARRLEDVFLGLVRDSDAAG